MQNRITPRSRRDFVRLTTMTASGFSLANVVSAETVSRNTIPLFDGKTLDGWLQIENSATSLSSGGITDQPAFINKLANSPGLFDEYKDITIELDPKEDNLIPVK